MHRINGRLVKCELCTRGGGNGFDFTSAMKETVVGQNNHKAAVH